MICIEWLYISNVQYANLINKNYLIYLINIYFFKQQQLVNNLFLQFNLFG